MLYRGFTVHCGHDYTYDTNLPSIIKIGNYLLEVRMACHPLLNAFPLKEASVGWPKHLEKYKSCCKQLTMAQHYINSGRDNLRNRLNLPSILPYLSMSA